jgi:DNA-binding MarR family transcriptional regulator
MNIKPSTTTRFIDKLELKGLVSRKAQGKTSFLYPTEKGMKLQTEIQKSWKNLHNRYSKILGDDEGKTITEMLDQTADKLEKHLND